MKYFRKPLVKLDVVKARIFAQWRKAREGRSEERRTVVLDSGRCVWDEERLVHIVKRNGLCVEREERRKYLHVSAQGRRATVKIRRLNGGWKDRGGNMIFRCGIYNRSSRSRGEEIAGPEITREFRRKKRGRRFASLSKMPQISFMCRVTYKIPRENIICKIISLPCEFP